MAKQVKQEENQELQEVLSTSGQWIIKNQNILSWCVIGIVAVILAVMAFNNYYLKPRAEAAQNEIAKAVVYFAAGQYETALNGDDADCIGFEAIADKYGSSKEGKLAALYAGVCYYNQKDYESAVNYLKKYSADDLNIAPAALLKTGDAYVELDQTEKAIACFEKAAASGNKVLAPVALKKAAIAYQALGKNAQAKKAYEQIKNDYPQSREASDVDKYINAIQ